MTLEVSSSLRVFPHHLSHSLSPLYLQQEGDLVLTGTPSGVGPVVPGDEVACILADASGKELSSLDFTAVAREGGYQFKADS